MLIKEIIEEDFVNYKKPSMFIATPYCSFKCDLENGQQLCHNMPLTKLENKNVSITLLIKKYLENDITKAVVFGGLEPLDSIEEVLRFIDTFRNQCEDDVIIYTLYTEQECKKEIEQLKQYKNIIVKFGRYRPNQEKHYDNILGVYLANDEQYAKIIS